MCEMITHCGFYLHFCTNYRHWVSSHISTGHLYIFGGKQKSILVFSKPSPWYRLELEMVGLEMMLGVRWDLTICSVVITVLSRGREIES